MKLLLLWLAVVAVCVVAWFSASREVEADEMRRRIAEDDAVESQVTK